MTLSRDRSSSSLYVPVGVQPISACTSNSARPDVLPALSGPCIVPLASLRTTPTMSFPGILASQSSAKRHSIPSRLVRLSSMNSIGSAHADRYLLPDDLFAREHSR